MSKEIEALEIIDELLDNYIDEAQVVDCPMTKERLLFLKQALTELKSIKETEPSEVLSKLRELRAKPFNWETLIKVLDEVEQSLLKAQENEKVLEILKPYLRLVGNCLQVKAPNVDTDDGWAWIKELTNEEEFDLLKRCFK